MCTYTSVVIVNMEKRQMRHLNFRKICDAMRFVKSYPRCKGCFIYAYRHDEVIAVKSDLAPMKVFLRSLEYSYDDSLFDDVRDYNNYYTTTSTYSPDSLAMQPVELCAPRMCPTFTR